MKTVPDPFCLAHFRASEHHLFRRARRGTLRRGAEGLFNALVTALCSSMSLLSSLGPWRSTPLRSPNNCRVCFGSVPSTSAGFDISVSIAIRSSGPQLLWRLAARLRQSFGISRFDIAIDTFGLPSNRGLKPISLFIAFDEWPSLRLMNSAFRLRG